MTERDPQQACEWFDERLEPWLDGELDAADAGRVADHVEGCARCARQVALARRIGAGLRDLGQPACPEHVGLGVAQPPRAAPRRVVPALAAGLMAGALALGVVWQMNGSAPSGEPSPAELAEARADLELALGYVAAAGRAAGRDVGNVLADEAIMRPLRSGLELNVNIPVPRKARNETMENNS